ncbi:exopolyphosphatase [Paracoccus kondratievae]|uniref:Exopolyphosphatase n=1 Tax=Paracoccus kondratievae TaxID=135740 RepID=A0AAD3NZ45_9RHOB|nr:MULTISPECIES: Ppx/GppA family phosphatase [Paracoccus]QFQ86974.1 exopolyphosphatase [Paracoccus kondratievae]GLK64296.1 exopolyphosphatase [Paracoccus kondratievae]SMG47026.1 exopolyphosphatase / guanosine-5'-triphosphate,3'-diphosphate pyrophosphatase [Paracoccus sp. J56]
MNGIMTASGETIEPFGRSLFERASERALSRVGVVDVGSNSIRMVVFDGAARSPAYFYNEKVMAGLGQGLATTGRLNPDGVRRAMSALRRFAVLADSMGIKPLTCVATAAVREAEDGPAFRKAVEKETGLKLWVIDGEEEARLSAQGVLLGWPDAKGLVCDIGGNSMELAEVKDGKVGRRISTPLGPFRLQQVKGGASGLRDHIRDTIEQAAEHLGRDAGQIYLVGGSWRAIARLDMERAKYPMTVLHEYRMSPDAVYETVKWISGKSVSEMRSMTGISQSRLELVPLASLALRQLVQSLQPKSLAVSSYGIREGLLYEQMPAGLRSRDPLIEAARFAERQMARMPGFGKKLYHFLEPIFVDLPPERDRLIKAACLLHDTTWRTHPDYRADACFDNVTRANMAALSHPERVFLGLSLLHRYKNSRANSPMAPLFALLSEKEIREAEVLGKAMRFGAMFSVKDPAEAGTLKLQRKKKQLELKLTRIGRALMGEVAEARFRTLAEAMGVTPVVTGD